MYILRLIQKVAQIKNAALDIVQAAFLNCYLWIGAFKRLFWLRQNAC